MNQESPGFSRGECQLQRLSSTNQPTNPLFMPGIALFFWLFETETAWQMIATDLTALLADVGFQAISQTLHAGGSLQTVQCRRPA